MTSFTPDLHNHCFQFLLGIPVVPREIEDNGYIRRILGDKQGGLENSFKLWSLCPLSQETSRSITHVRCIKILTGLRGFNCKYFKIPLSEKTWTQRLTQNKYGKMTLQPRSHVRILIYRTWTIQNELKLSAPYTNIFKFISELQQPLRRRLRKRHLKSEFALLQTLSRLFQLV